jgi:hypothetical protein
VSGKNNVNPDRYKVAGRDRPNETIPAGKRPLDDTTEQEVERWHEHEEKKKGKG